MRATSVVLVGVIAALAVLAGTALAQPSSQTVIEDAPDDGGVERFEQFPGLNSVGCFGVERTGTCTDAPPAMQILSVSFAETRSEFVVDLELAGLSQDLRGAADERSVADPDPGDPKPGSSRHATQYLVCWAKDEDDGCQAAALLQIDRFRGNVDVRSWIQFQGDGCPEQVPCQFAVPYTIKTGQPGHIRWTIPRGLLHDVEAGDTIYATFARTTRLDEFRHAPGFSTENPTSDGDLLNGAPLFLLDGDDDVDVAEPDWDDDAAAEAAAFTFQLPLDPSLPTHVASHRVLDPAGDYPGPERPDLDILETSFHADAHNLTVAVKKAAVNEEPEDHLLFVHVGFGEEIAFLDLHAFARDGARSFEALRPFADDADPPPVRGSVSVGEPGWINFTMPRSEIPVLGLRTSWLWAGADAWTDREPASTEPATDALGVHLARYQRDLVGPANAYTVRISGPDAGNGNATDEIAPPGRSLLPDRSLIEVLDAEDASLPTEANPTGILSGGEEDSASTQDAFEITRVRAVAETRSMLRVSLELKELRSVEVPDAYDAVLYATAMETDAGRFLAGHYKAHEQKTMHPGAPDLPEYFCTADTAVLTGSPALPPQGNPIEGFVRPSQSLNQSQTTTKAAIQYSLPRECLGGAPAGSLQTRAVGGATYLVRFSDANSPGEPQLTLVDEATQSEDRLLEPTPEPLTQNSEPPSSTATQANPFSAPFGLENFWDIFGIVATGVASIVGAVLVRRRRNILKEYLAEIDRILEDHAEDPTGRESALRGVEAQAKDDLVDGAMSENQYVVIRDRISEEISDARVDGIEEAFSDLPYGLLRKLKQMAADGVLSTEDRRLFSTMLEDSGLTEDAKERIRRKLDVWTSA